jgi:hypothetical protein
MKSRLNIILKISEHVIMHFKFSVYLILPLIRLMSNRTILSHYKCTHCQKAIEAKERSGNLASKRHFGNYNRTIEIKIF